MTGEGDCFDRLEGKVDVLIRFDFFVFGRGPAEFKRTRGAFEPSRVGAEGHRLIMRLNPQRRKRSTFYSEEGQEGVNWSVTWRKLLKN